MQESREKTAVVQPTVSAELFRLLVHSVRDYAIFLLDPEGHVVSWNEGAQRIKGYTHDEIVGKHFSVFYPESAKATGWPQYELQAASRDGRFEDEGWRIRKDGSQFWADVVITAVRDGSGTLVGFAKVTRDLTERKMAEEALRQSEERYRMIIEAVRDYAIFMLDPDGLVVTWNTGAERLNGYTAAEIIGRHFSCFYPPEAVASGWPERELTIARAEGRFEEEGWRIRKDGSQFWATVVLSAIRDHQGKLQGFSKVTRDIGEKKKLSEELNARLTELDATNRVLAEKNHEVETFVYGVSHDVRGPLVNLQGFSKEIERSCTELLNTVNSEPDVPATLKERLHRIIDEDLSESTHFMETAVTHLSNIIDGLLRLSRIGRIVYEYKVVNVSALVNRIVDSTNLNAAEITTGHLPEVWADASALEQVFSNLIANAIRYCDPSRRCRIEIGGHVTLDGKFVEYFVKDNGRGLPQRAQAQIFTAFRRHHPDAGPGEGMGLATVRRILDRLHGDIRVESREGQGSTFYVTLPNPAGSV